MGLLIDIEGIDGTGKGTQSHKLVERLQHNGVSAQLISFPRYEATLFGHAVGDFLNGRFGSLEQVSPFLAALLFAGDRFESRNFLERARATYDVVVLDRYVVSNVAHQAAKGRGAERQELMNWILQVEHSVFGMPHADLILLLDLPVAQAQTLVASKIPRNYTLRQADIQEADPAYLESVREVYLELARDPHWRIVHCAEGSQTRAVDDIAEELWQIVQNCRSA